MILRVEMPLIDPSLRSGTLTEWHVKEGDKIEFGDDLCNVALDEFAVLRRTARATLLSTRKRTRLKSNLETRKGKVLVNVVLTASDTGILEKVIKQPGDLLTIGDTLAVVSTTLYYGKLHPDRWAKAAAMRVVPNIVNTPEQY